MLVASRLIFRSRSIALAADRGGWLILCVLALCFVQTGCKKKSEPSASQATPPTVDPSAAVNQAVERFSFLDDLANCQVFHRGVSLDFGARSAQRHRGFSLGPFDGVETREVAGTTFAQLFVRRIRYDFWIHSELEAAQVTIRAKGGRSDRLWVYVDQELAGVGKLKSSAPAVLNFRTLKKTLAPGRHTLTLRMRGRPTAEHTPYAEVDWVRIGPSQRSVETFSAPTAGNILNDVVLNKVAERSFVLKGPGAVRCPVMIEPGTHLKVALGYWGEGGGRAEISLIADGDYNVLLDERDVPKPDPKDWDRVDIDLSKYAGKLVYLEFRARQSRRSGRVAFGNPELQRRPPKLPDNPARTVVLVLAAGLDRDNLPPWGQAKRFPALAVLSRSAVVFENYRQPTTVTSAVVASILSGLPPGSHGLEDPEARLPAAIQTLNSIVKEASGRTAMFTAVPPSFEAFGFDTGWDAFESISPVQDVPATEPIRLGLEWLQAQIASEPEQRRLLVLHLRGSHPPWDLTRKEVQELPPEGYGGVLGARRGALALSKVRKRRRRSLRRLQTRDWERLHALAGASLEKQDLELGRLVRSLKESGEWDHTLFIFAGDVPMGDPPAIPHAPAPSLGEDHLLSPLFVKFPGKRLVASRSRSWVTPLDLPTTILAALGLKTPRRMRGLDLAAVAAGVTPLAGRWLSATLGNRYSTRLGSWLLSGYFGAVPALCRLDVDPACATDLLQERPLTSSAMWTRTFGQLSVARSKPARLVGRESADLDDETAAALTVWGH